jgi:signal transduction histidine kinase
MENNNAAIVSTLARGPLPRPAPAPLLGIADASLSRELVARVALFAPAGRVATASSVLELRLQAGKSAPRVICVDCELLEDLPVPAALASLLALAPVVLLAPVEKQAEVAPLVVSGEVEFVARAGDFVPILAAVIERRLRWAELSASLLGAQWQEFPDDLGSIFRHEINNPLTGILGNAELLLSHRERLSPVDTQRLQIVVDLAVRLRETIRRLSSQWENRAASA